MQQSSYFTNLPLEIVSDILSRLPVLHMVRLKCVCKTWLELFESPEFSKLHLSKSSAVLLVHQEVGGRWSSLHIYGFENELEVDLHELNYVPITDYELSEFMSRSIAGSVDGFLCLLKIGNFGDNIRICNPFTREYISLPMLENYVQFPSVVTYGFGVSTIGCQYKVVRIFHESELDQAGVCVGIPRSDCHVYTLGTTGTWRSICIATSPPLYYDSYSTGAFLNGNLHWLARDLKDSYVMSCLDLDKEMIRTFSAPHLPPRCLESLVVLGDCLSVCDNTSENDIVIWIMKDYGVEKSWTKEFVISKIPDISGGLEELIFPIKVLRNGDILMKWDGNCFFYYSNKTKTVSKVGIVGIMGCQGLDAILHVPSFVSLTCFGMENVDSF